MEPVTGPTARRQASLLPVLGLCAGLLGCRPGPGAADGGPDLQPVTAAELHAQVRASQARVVLVNVWASWCPPCRDEFPDLLEARREFGERGFELLLVSADPPGEEQTVRSFLAEQGVGFTSYHKRQADLDFMQELSPGWSGILPVSFLYRPDGALLRTWEGRLSYQELATELEPLLE